MNTQKIIDCVNYFEEEPMRLDMSLWLQTNPSYPYTNPTFRPPCSTVACLAGSAVFLEAGRDLNKVREMVENTGHYSRALSYFALGRRIFDITPDQAHRLFNIEHWPDQFGGPYDDSTRDLFDYYQENNLAVYRYIRKKMVQILRARCDFFIRTNGRDFYK